MQSMDLKFDPETAPADVARIYRDARQAMTEGGREAEEAHHVALRQIQLAGWYLTGEGWKRLGPDVRDRVNVRRAELQPDGRYLIRDVDVFYPNAVKGGDGDVDVYTAERILQAVENTNRMIAAGGQRPSLTRVHPNPLSKAMGTFIASHGAPINWRESPLGEGWARCDLSDVSPEVVADWRGRKITGLSAGIVKDAAGLNERFGHVAMLGGESQALSSLPATEVYAAGETVCFSVNAEDVTKMAKTNTGNFCADSGEIQRRVNGMDKEMIQKMKDGYAALHAAYSSFDTGEPGADEKVKEAEKKMHDLREQYAAGTSAGTKPDDSAATSSNNAAGEATGTKLPAAPTLTKTTDQTGKTVDVDAGKTSFSAADSASFAAQLETQSKLIREQQVTISALLGKNMRNDFQKQVDQLKGDGHQFDADAAYAQFDACDGNKKQIEALVGFLKKSPKRGSIASIGAVFGADGSSQTSAAAAGSAQAVNDVQTILERHAPTVNFDAEDIKLGQKIGAVFAGLAR